jgi:hypothetical protein
MVGEKGCCFFLGSEYAGEEALACPPSTGSSKYVLHPSFKVTFWQSPLPLITLLLSLWPLADCVCGPVLLLACLHFPMIRIISTDH